ncbi:MAG: uroporphyrinogen-III synthase [Thermoguttaceae bacterium]|nr:uroporphyrinogen-III synthase [Thermoguttaceae bacterium]
MSERQVILLTRPYRQSLEVRPLFEEAGFCTEIAPAVEIVPPDDWEKADRLLGRLGRFDWLVFSSANGVRFFCQRLRRHGQTVTANTAAVGSATAEVLAAEGITVTRTAADARAEGLVSVLEDEARRGARFLLVRGSRAREVLSGGLRALGGEVDELVVYRQADVPEADKRVAERMAAGDYAYTTVTSSAIARSLVRLYGGRLKQTRLVSISPLTGGTLAELGFPAYLQAAEATMAGMLDAIRNAEK